MFQQQLARLFDQQGQLADPTPEDFEEPPITFNKVADVTAAAEISTTLPDSQCFQFALHHLKEFECLLPPSNAPLP